MSVQKRNVLSDLESRVAFATDLSFVQIAIKPTTATTTTTTTITMAEEKKEEHPLHNGTSLDRQNRVPYTSRG
jgi:hypothetical protein